MLSNHLILYCPLLLLPSIFLSIRVFSNESVLPIKWPKYWSFSFSISPSNEYSRLISFRTDWLNLLAVQGTHKNLLQHHSSKASILWCSAFFIVQLSHPYMTTWKTITLTRWTFVVMSLLFNRLSRLVTAFLPRSKCLLISWLQSPSAVILEPSKIKSVTISIVSPSICHGVMGLDAMILVFWMLNFSYYAITRTFFSLENLICGFQLTLFNSNWIKLDLFGWAVVLGQSKHDRGEIKWEVQEDSVCLAGSSMRTEVQNSQGFMKDEKQCYILNFKYFVTSVCYIVRKFWESTLRSELGNIKQKSIQEKFNWIGSFRGETSLLGLLRGCGWSKKLK